MIKLFKTVLIVIVALALILLAYRLLFIRVVNYEIAGIKIPSEYNFLTGRVKPIVNYHGKAIKTVVEDRKAQNIGLSEDQVVAAQVRWAIFEEWANAHSEYKGWDKNPDIFKKAYDAFRLELKSIWLGVQIVR